MDDFVLWETKFSFLIRRFQFVEETFSRFVSSLYDPFTTECKVVACKDIYMVQSTMLYRNKNKENGGVTVVLGYSLFITSQL